MYCYKLDVCKTIHGRIINDDIRESWGSTYKRKDGRN
jgi:hypothetical protein